jgi:hypothetical protein
MANDIEKTGFDVDHFENDGLKRDASDSSGDGLFSMGFTPAEQKKIIRRIDFRLVTTVGVMYCVSLMDRTNLSLANIAGMKTDLDLAVGFRYVS